MKEVHAKLSMRQKIREMILLALRCLLILLIVAAMARPGLRGGRGLSGKRNARYNDGIRR
ncbi:MAG: hypothetical protein U5N86_11730 [Planctomycetota bacterium]|nr:hypothetical protein [Planctomycetota bacterium]